MVFYRIRPAVPYPRTRRPECYTRRRRVRAGWLPSRWECLVVSSSRKLLLLIPTVLVVALVLAVVYVAVIRPARRNRAGAAPARTATVLPAATPVSLVLDQGNG